MIEPGVPAVALDHVGIAASDLSLPLTTMLGGIPETPRAMPSGVSVARFGPGQTLELVWPHRERSPVTSFLARRGPGLHHVALAVDAPLSELRPRLILAGVRLASDVEPSSDGRLSLFIHPESTGGVLVELVQGRR